MLGLKATPEQLEKIAAWLEKRELARSHWMKEHDVAGKSLAATVLTRLIDEERANGGTPDERLMQLVRSVAFEEFDAGSPGPAGDTTP